MKIRERKFSGTKNSAPTALEIANRGVALEAAKEGMVLLKNEEHFLPIKKGAKVALFGGGAQFTIKGGTGSGDVCVREKVSVYDGLKNAGCVITSEAWLAEYAKEYEQARLEWRDLILKEAGGARDPRFFDVYASHAFVMPTGRAVAAADVQDADVAIYVLSRVAGEGDDRFERPGDYYLTEEELQFLQELAAVCQNIVLLLNIGGQIEMKEILAIPQIKAILHISQPGMEGGNAAAQILVGEATPSGKLTDTWGWNYSDFPNADVFSYKNGDTTTEDYTEGIYVGYRYFDAFEKNPLYPFGFGLSYTDFAIEVTGIRAAQGDKQAHNCAEILVKVTNTGSTYAGKEVVQIYAACPQARMTKEMRRLVGFAKTELLAPGASQELAISVHAYLLASFFAEDHVWMTQAGDYGIFAGNSIADASLAGVLKVPADVIWETCAAICPVQKEIEEMVPTKDLAAFETAWKKEAEEKNKPVVTLENLAPADEKYKVGTLPSQAAFMQQAKELVEQMTQEQQILFGLGEVSRAHDVAFGASGIMVPGAAGETSSATNAVGVPPMAVADGPAGVRIVSEYEADEASNMVYTVGFTSAIEDGFFADDEKHPGATVFYQYTTAFPIGMMIAQTWNEKITEAVGLAAGKEMENLGIALWLAPGMNIHRNPLCGRNFEYYAEDPLLSGRIAAAMTMGVQTVPGTGTTIKHFAVNNLEVNRFGSSSNLTERTLREIYLKGFEIAVKTAQPMSVMTSYNLVNGVHSPNSKDLCETVMREEWGFEGAIMTDWCTTDRGASSYMCMYAGNDLIMPGVKNDIANIEEALANGKLSIEDVKKCNARLMKLMLQTLIVEDCAPYRETMKDILVNI